jgi:hypothetical protein
MKCPPILGCTAALAKSPAEIEKIARPISIEIQVVGKNRVGSGIIVHHQGNLYTLVTNRHVVCGSRSCSLPIKQAYRLGTADGQRYQVPVTGVNQVFIVHSEKRCPIAILVLVSFSLRYGSKNLGIEVVF